MMTKILFIDPDSIQSKLLAGGQGRITWNIASRLARRGNEITLLTAKYPGYKDTSLDGIHYIHIGLPTNSLGINFISFLVALPFKLIFRKDDLAFECLSAPITTLLSPLFFRKKVVGITAMVEAETFGKKYHIPLGIWEKLGMKLYKHVVAYSAYYKQKVKKLNPTCEVTVISPGIPVDFLETPLLIRPKERYALYIGRIDILQKGLDILIESLIDKQNSPDKIIIAGFGKPSEEKLLRELINLKGLEKKVLFIGRVEGNEKMELLKNAAFGLVPSRFETFCVSALEFLSLGKKIVIFDIDGLKWVPDYCCERIPPFDTKLLSEAIQKISHEDIGINEAEQIRDFAKDFEWEKIIDSYEYLIHTIVTSER